MTRRWRKWLLSSSAIGLTLLSGCGGGSESESRQVSDAVSGYLTAVADNDGTRACRLLTREAQLRVFRRKQAHAGFDHPVEACASVVKNFGSLYGRKRLRRVAVSRIEVDGDRARASADGVPVRLERTDGNWKLASGIAQDVGDMPSRSQT